MFSQIATAHTDEFELVRMQVPALITSSSGLPILQACALSLTKAKCLVEAKC